MTPIAYLQVVAALAVVLALIFALAWLAKRGGLGPVGPKPGRRLAVIEVAAVDAKRRLVLLRRDDREYLVLLGPDRDLLLEAGSERPAFALPASPAEPAGP
ncbi:MAG: hypothetical protein OHK0024_12780 [Thalassobaculales bacterium]